MAEVKKIAYKYCIVPMCHSTTIKNLSNFFFRVPNNITERKKWCKLMKRDLIGPRITKYVCEDHFNVQNDAENLMKYQLVGGTLKLKANVCPHKFDCQKAGIPQKQQGADEKKVARQKPCTEKSSSGRVIFEQVLCYRMAEVKRPKSCFVPMCQSSKKTTPDKHFFAVPTNKERRELWCKRIKRDLIKPKSVRHVCEDHFDLEKDTANLMQSRMIGGRLKLKPDVLPHKFPSQMVAEDNHDSQMVAEDIYDPDDEPDPDEPEDPLLDISKNKDSEMEWTNEQVQSLILEYKKRPSLWDPSDPQYRRGATKYEAWHKMAEIFECDIVDIRKKLTSVFASYRREKSRVRHGSHTSWFLYDQLGFLPNHIPNAVPREKSRKRKIYKSSSDESDNPDDDDDDGGDEIGLESDVEVKQEPQDVVVEYEGPTKVHTKKKLTRGRQIDSQARVTEVRPESEVRRDPEIRQDSKVSRYPDVRREGKDECDSFGEYIAMSLRKHDERTRATMKQAINNIIFELEMKKYNSEPYTIVVSEVNPLKDYGT